MNLGQSASKQRAHMKETEEPPIHSRKTLPSRKARKPAKARAPKTTASKPRAKKTILDKDVERELVRVFGER
jgi:hypothetical protein